MKLDDFDYDLPESLIAQVPEDRRDRSRMMVLERGSREISHLRFDNFPGLLDPGSVLVLNETKVIPARAWGIRDGRDIEFLFLRAISQGTWEVLCRPARRVRSGDTIRFSPDLEGKIIEEGPEGLRHIHFSTDDVLSELRKIGYAPLPPYIKRARRDDRFRDFDLNRYQTVFASREGSIAAPTAGLHFTPEVLERIKNRKIHIAPIILNVGLATFQPVRVENIEEHLMLEESYLIPAETAQTVNQAKQDGRPVIAVGTTSVRALESAYNKGALAPGPGATRLFIRPGYSFRAVDRLLTNFHLPKSTLLMLISALAGTEIIREAYHQAVQMKYRFFSYGDCMFIK